MNSVKAENKQCEQFYTLEEIAKKICDSYEDCTEGKCPGFDYCHKKHNGVLEWLKKAMKND